jgi:hypothetical protein
MCYALNRKESVAATSSTQALGGTAAASSHVTHFTTCSCFLLTIHSILHAKA